MKRIGLTVAVVAAVVMIGRAAQAPPDLSGTWRPQDSNSGQVNPFELTITQAADSVTIRQPLGNPESMTLKLNAETRTPISGIVNTVRFMSGSLQCGDATPNPAQLPRTGPNPHGVAYLIAVTSLNGTGAPPRDLLTSAASMNAMISTVSSIGTGDVPVLKNSTIATMRP